MKNCIKMDILLVADLVKLLRSRFQERASVIIFVTLLVSFFEGAMIAGTIPLFKILSNEKNFLDYDQGNLGIGWVSQITHTQYLLFFSVFCLSVTYLRLSLIKIHLKFIADVTIHMSRLLMRGYVSHSFEELDKQHSSAFTSAMAAKINLLSSNVIQPLTQGVVALFFAIPLFLFLTFLQPEIMSMAISGFAVYYLIIFKNFRKKSKSFRDGIAFETTNISKVAQDIAILRRELKLNHQLAEKQFDFFSQSVQKLKSYQSRQQYFSQSPRILIEGTVLVAVSLSIFIQLSAGLQGNEIFLIWGPIIIGLQRILPHLQNIYATIAMVSSSTPLIRDCYDMMANSVSKEVFESYPIANISLTNLTIKKPGKDEILFTVKNLSLEKGDSLIVFGASGCGKSQLVDCISGLRKNWMGSIRINDVSFSNPEEYPINTRFYILQQSPFLFDADVKSNLSIGISITDKKKFDDAIGVFRVNIKKSRPLILKTQVGEEGRHISGGQKQRVSVARALFSDSDVIIFDEATNALDQDTEKLMVQHILKCARVRIVIFVSHNRMLEQHFTHSLKIEYNRATLV
ncbi:MAG: ABC transporter ATP-binding protein, partial [Paracoccaceae bacterium]